MRYETLLLTEKNLRINSGYYGLHELHRKLFRFKF